MAAEHLCDIAEAVVEPQLLLRKAESAKSSVALFCQVSLTMIQGTGQTGQVSKAFIFFLPAEALELLLLA